MKQRAAQWDLAVSEYLDLSGRYLGLQQQGSVYAFDDAGDGHKRVIITHSLTLIHVNALKTGVLISVCYFCYWFWYECCSCRGRLKSKELLCFGDGNACCLLILRKVM